ncbi:guanylin-like [Genypterus blacodes]|uniref:guanylin-like n=1 Tax=Genypterus blacodes TaxID=154954 RepID=UPI003F771448
MKFMLSTVTLLVLALSRASEAVKVHEGGLSFSMEAVKKLQELTDNNSMTGNQSPRLQAGAGSVCDDPMLPQQFLPLCEQKGASASLARLAMVPLDVCEICAFAACTGC